MKHLSLLSAILLLSSCYQALPDDAPEATEPTPEGQKHFVFTIKGDFRSVTFSEESTANDLSSLPINSEATDAWGDAPEARTTRAADYLVADGSSMTDLWVLDTQGGEIKQQLHQTPSDADWGEPQMNLTLGTHHILFLASRGTEPQYSNGTVTWSRPNDTFFCDYEVTVVKTSNGNRAVTLDRCATKLSLVIADAIPSGTTSVTFTPATWHNGWNMLTGEPLATNAYVSRYDLPSSWWGSTGSILNMWGLSAAAEWQTDISIVSRTATSVNAEAIITDAPFVANRVTKYSGNLFSDASASALTLNAEWLDAYEGVY